MNPSIKAQQRMAEIESDQARAREIGAEIQAEIDAVWAKNPDTRKGHAEVRKLQLKGRSQIVTLASKVPHPSYFALLTDEYDRVNRWAW